MYINSFTANENTRLSLENKIKSSKLSHAVLIFGAKGCGINHFANLLAADIIGADENGLRLIQQEAHPSVQIIKGEGASGQIKVERIRQINENVNFSSISGEKRVVIIQECQMFNQSSANAMLKNIEEPKDDITYILTCRNPSALLPTIRSRCSAYTLIPPSLSQCKEYFKDQDSKTADFLTDIYAGNIGLVKAAFDSPKRMDILKKALDIYSLVIEKNYYDAEREIYFFNKKKEEFLWFLQDMEYIGLKNIENGGEAFLDAAFKARYAAERNANIALAAENFLIAAKNNI